MVKNIVSVVLSLIILFCGTWYEQDFVLRQFNEFKDLTEVMLVKAENGEATVDDMEAMQVSWEDKKKYLHVFIPHNEIKEIGLWISESVAFCKYGNTEELVDKLRVLNDLSKQIPSTFMIRIENLF